MTLMPGDVLATGTPSGVGMGMKPPVFLKKGDVMTLGIDGLGQQRQRWCPSSAEAGALLRFTPGCAAVIALSGATGFFLQNRTTVLF